MFFNYNNMLGVWRSGSAPVLGTGGRWVDPSHPDQLYYKTLRIKIVLV